jgi:hypothetical protein
LLSNEVESKEEMALELFDELVTETIVCELLDRLLVVDDEFVSEFPVEEILEVVLLSDVEFEDKVVVAVELVVDVDVKVDEFVKDSVEFDDSESELEVLFRVDEVVEAESTLLTLEVAVVEVVRRVLEQINKQSLEVKEPPRSLFMEALATISWLIPVEIERNSTKTRNTKPKALRSECSDSSRFVFFEPKSKNFKQDKHIGFHYMKFRFSETIARI